MLELIQSTFEYRSRRFVEKVGPVSAYRGCFACIIKSVVRACQYLAFSTDLFSTWYRPAKLYSNEQAGN